MYFNFQNEENPDGKSNRFVHKGNENSSNGESLNEHYSAYEQIPKELLRDLTRSSNFRHLNEESKRQR